MAIKQGLLIRSLIMSKLFYIAFIYSVIGLAVLISTVVYVFILFYLFCVFLVWRNEDNQLHLDNVNLSMLDQFNLINTSASTKHKPSSSQSKAQYNVCNFICC